MASTLTESRHHRRDAVTLGVQAAICDTQNRVLLVRHGYRPGWHFPGGGVERNETLVSAMKREIEEETGVIYEEAPGIFAIYAHFDAFPGDHIVLFHGGRWRRPRIPAPNREIVEHGFFALDALPDVTTPQTLRRIRELFAGVPPAPHW